MNTYEVNVNTGYGLGGGFYNFAPETETPTQEGWYWAYSINSSEWLMIRVARFESSNELRPMWGSSESKFKYFSHWIGPLPMPEKP